jgi:multiple sugar transport system substrate-binding protein
MKNAMTDLFVTLALFLAMPAVLSAQSDSGKIVLQVWNGFDPATSEDGKHHEELYAQYEKLHPDVQIQHTIMTYDQLKQKTIVAGQAGDSPDVVHMLGEWVPEFVSMGLLADVTAPMKAWEDYKAFPSTAWNVASVDGKIYGVPSVASTRVLVYREDLLKNAGVAVPKTWEDLRAAAKKLTKGSTYGFAFCSAVSAVRGPQEFAVFLWSTGGELVKKEKEKWVPGFTQAQARDVFQLYYNLMFVDKSVPPYSIGWEWQDLDPAFAAGTVAMAQNGSWIQQRAADGVSSQTWKTAAFPYAKVPATYLEVKVEGVGKNAKHKQAAVDFLKWLYTRDNMVYITQTDNLPSRSDSSASKYWKNDPVWRGTFNQEVRNGHSMPPISIGPVLQDTMQELQQVLYKKSTPEQSAKSFFLFVQNYLDTQINKK